MSYKGIDVSYCNGRVDWNKAKAAGLQFAIIQLGYGNDDTSQDDKQFTRNASECERLGIPWGAYLYSYTQTVAGAQSELQHMLRLLRDHHPQYPVFIDMEDADGYKVKHGGIPPAQTNTNIIKTVCNGLQKAGYKAGYYCNRDWYYNHLYPAQLKSYEFWYARPGVSKPDLPYDLWQTEFGEDGGKWDGVNGGVDLNVSYRDYSAAGAPKIAPTGATFKCDTTTIVTVPAGKEYTAKITCNCGRPNVYAGMSGIFDTSLVSQSGNEYFFKFTPISRHIGKSVGIYINGCKPSAFVLRVGTAVECDTTVNFSREIGNPYEIGLTSQTKPEVTAGSGNIAAICDVYSIGGDKWLCPIVGYHEGVTGIYTAVPGEQPTKRFEFKVV
ncbi:MAG: glycoside hydrolase family 25 protein [Oscillospiraceae bacterium]|nr:glycoside hydrolase family 25 protein [Oscillospiraceae bacterium]